MSPTDTVAQSDIDAPWWEESTKTKALPKLQRLFAYYSDQDRDRLSAYTAYSRLYTNRDILGNDYLKNYTAAFSVVGSEYSRVPLNVCKVMVDAVHARLTRPAIDVEFLPASANWSLRKRSRQATQFVRQQTHQCGLRNQEAKANKDSLVYGLGCIKTHAHPKIARIENDRVHPRDIFVDPIEVAANGTPTHLYQRMFVNRGKLKKLFPKNKGGIDSAHRVSSKKSDWSDDAGAKPAANMVEVVEAWRLPSWPGADDGKHCIFINGAALVFEDWNEEDFPFTFVHWKDDPTIGFFGISLVEELIGLHFDINTSILHCELAIESIPKPYVLVPGDAEVNEGQLGNLPATIINHTGRAPQIIMPNSVPVDIVNYVDTQWRRALSVSALVSLSMPEKAGNQGETGAAFDTIIDIQSTELAPAFKNREDFIVRLGEQQMNAGRILDQRLKKEGKGGFKTVLRKDRNTVEAIEWKLFSLDPRVDSYVVQASPASALSQTFGGRLSQVKELIGLGLIPLSRAFKLLDIPDLDGEMRIQNASLDFIERIMEEILDDGVFTAPEPTMDLRLAYKVTQKHINLAQAMSVDDDRVTLLYDFLQGVNDLVKKEQEATQLQAQGMAPGAVGGPPATDISGASPGATALQGNVMGQI